MTDVAIPTPNADIKAFEPGSLPELIQVAEIMARSDMVPKDYRGKPGNIVVAGMAGRDLGLSLYNSLQSHAVINGRAMLWGDTPLALVRASGKLAKGYPKEGLTGTIKEGTREAYCITKRVGEDEEKRSTFSMEDAKIAGLWGKEGPWRSYPDRMLRMRARSFLLRDEFSDVLKGVAIAEEYEGHQEEINVTPATTGNEALRERMAAAMGAAGMAKDPTPPPEPTVVEGVVEDPVPDFSRMLAEQIGEVLEQEAQRRGMDEPAYRALVTATLKGSGEKRRPLNRGTAVEVWRAIQAAEVESPSEPENRAPGAQETLL